MIDDQNNNNTEEPAPTWFLDEGIPGTGNRPGWLPEKFKSAADMSKSYHELEKKFGSAPESYDMSKSKYLDDAYEPFQDLMNFAKEKRVPKDVMDKMIDSFDKYLDEFSYDQAEEIKKFGENADERLKTLDNWAKINLSESSYNALTSTLKTADAMKALEELRGKMMSNSTMVPAGNDNGSTTGQNLDDLRSEMVKNLEKYKTDAVYRKDLQSRLNVAAKNSGIVDKVGY